MRKPMDRKSTLETLDKLNWDKPDFDSHLVRRCHELIKIPLDKLTVEDLRLLIGQQIGLKYLVDIAIEKLTADILAEGDFYPGDLLQSVLSIDSKYWADNKNKWVAIDKLLRQNTDALQDVKLETENFYKGGHRQ